MPEIRTAPQITQAMLDLFVGQTTRVTDVTEGSVVRTMIEAVAIEMAREELGIAQATNEAIEQAAYTTFGFERLDARAAGGQVSLALVPATAPITYLIPRGTRVGVPGGLLKVYETITDTSVIMTGSPSDPLTIAIPIVALVPGTVGNTQAGTITALLSGAQGVTGVTNERAVFNGHDIETDAERRARFRQFIRSLQRATKDAVLAGALSTRILDPSGYILDEVRKVNTVEHDRTRPSEAALVNPNPDNPRPGTIWLFIHNGVGTPSGELVSACQQVIDGYEDASTVPSTLVAGYKAAAIEAIVFPAVEVIVPVTVQYDLDIGYLPEQVEAGVADAVNSFFSELDVADTLRVEPLKRRVSAVPGVLDFAMPAPSTNVTASYKQLIIPGMLTVTRRAN